MNKTNEIGYTNLNNDTLIPEIIQDIRLFSVNGGPVNTAVMKPFRTIVYPAPVIRGKDTKIIVDESQLVALKAYQDLLTEAKGVVSGARGRFVMYLTQEQTELDYRLVGKIYKL